MDPSSHPYDEDELDQIRAMVEMDGSGPGMCVGFCPDDEARWLATLEAESVASEWNAMLQIVCRLHPDGADGFHEFQRWYEDGQDGKWLGVARACGWWLGEQLGWPKHREDRDA